MTGGLAMAIPDGRRRAAGRVDVRLKFAVLLAASLVIFVWNALWLQSAALVGMILLVLSSGVPARIVAGLFRLLLPAFLLVVAIQGLFSPLGETPVLELPDTLPWIGGAAFLRWEGLLFGLVVCCRLAIPLLAFAYVFSTSTPNEIVQGLVRMGVPYKGAFLVSTTFRFVPQLLAEFEAMKDAQRLRGIDFDALGLWRKLVAMGRMLVPLIVTCLQRAQQMEVALLGRGFTGAKGRTFLDPGRAKLTAAEWLAIALVLALPPAALAARLLLGLGREVV